MIGPEGGVLEGAAGGLFAGVRLEIPPGALARPTMITLRRGETDVPLAPNSERIGPMFAIEPAGEALAMPALLTLPFAPRMRSALETTDESCRAWLFADGAWTNVSQVASTSASVTVRIERLSVATAGAFNIARPPLCLSLGGCGASRPSNRCRSQAGGFCLLELPAPRVRVPPDFRQISVENGVVSYLGNVATREFAVGHYNVFSPSFEQTVSRTFVPPGDLSTARRGGIEQPVFRDLEGGYWVGLQGYGNIHFPANATPIAYDTAPAIRDRVFGVVRGTAPTRLYAEQISVAVIVGTPPISIYRLRATNLAANFTATVAATSDPRSDFFAQGDSRNTYTAIVETGSLSAAGSVSFRALPAGQRLGSEVSLAGLVASVQQSPNGSQIVAVVRSASAPTSVLRTRSFVSGSELWTETSVPGVAIDAVIENTGRMLSITSSRPEILVHTAGGGVAGVLLTVAAMGTPEYNRLLPRALRLLPETNQLLLVTVGDQATGPLFFLLSDLRV